jgi:hypothetical protein
VLREAPKEKPIVKEVDPHEYQRPFLINSIYQIGDLFAEICLKRIAPSFIKPPAVEFEDSYLQL